MINQYLPHPTLEALPRKVRASSADRALACSGSLLEVTYPYNPPSPQASEGTAAHAVLERFVRGTLHDVEAEVEATAARTGCDLDGLRFLVGEAMRAWHAITNGIDLDNIEAEATLDGPYTTGRCDVVLVDGPRAIVLDWKMGYSDDRHAGQLAAYASGVRARYGMPTSGVIETYEVHVRRGRWYRLDVTGDDLDDFEDRIARALRNPAGQWAPSTKACKYCPSRMSCEARSEFLTYAARLIGEVGSHATRAAVATVYDRAEALRQALREYDSAVTDCLDNGPLVLPDGRRVQWRETRRSEVVVGKAWSTLREAGLSPTEITGRLKLSKTALKTAIAEKAPTGMKGKAGDAVLRKLEEAGAISTSVSVRREVVASKEVDNG
jgi:hypothetical protein